MRAIALTAARLARLDFLELTKPRLSSFVLLVVALAAWLGAGGAIEPGTLLLAVVGTGLVAGGANALNMVIERDLDARMARTRARPIPSGRLEPHEAAIFGGTLTVAGLLLLLGTTPLASLLAALTSASYLLVYTPLKRVTTLNTHVGAVPGALPALIGWAAARGQLDPAAWTLFAIVYLWQVPHFLSIAWLYRDDYARGGYRMLPSADPAGRLTGRQAVLGAAALVPASLLPSLAGITGAAYFLGALVVGLWFVRRSIAFAMERTPATARGLLRASLVYLPAVLLLMFLDRLP
ncbi:MAG TPA: heme o synthase [Planctomycetota bacterium]|nr:heme o synthase [Planctomycetota bacterium]